METTMKEHVHLTPGQIDILLHGELSAEAVRLAVRVLLAGCPVCMETVRVRVLEPDGSGVGQPEPKRPRPLA